MGAKTWIVAHSTGLPASQLRAGLVLNEAATDRWVAELFPGRRFPGRRLTDLSRTSPPQNTVVAGCFDGLRIVITTEVAVDRPSTLERRFIAPQGTTVLHAMHSVVDWFACAVWEGGQLQRSLSLAPDNGVIEDVGTPLAFEQPFWQGQHPALDPQELQEGEQPYPLPFHPLELGDVALGHLFGFHLEGLVDPQALQPEQVPMLMYGPQPSGPAAAARPWWRFWR